MSHQITVKHCLEAARFSVEKNGEINRKQRERGNHALAEHCRVATQSELDGIRAVMIAAGYRNDSVELREIAQLWTQVLNWS